MRPPLVVPRQVPLTLWLTLVRPSGGPFDAGVDLGVVAEDDEDV
jgi:hypothetical protein